jgi:mono/diheme cytochrome c family protein
VAIGLLAIVALAQFVPYGRAHSNPPVTRTPHWDSARTEQLVAGACSDCHTNTTNWRWYSNIAPGSWLIQNDVNGGRKRLNFSRWDGPQPAVGDIVDQVSGGGMPPLQYKLVHPAARLTTAERRALVHGLEATYAADPPPVRGGGG